MSLLQAMSGYGRKAINYIEASQPVTRVQKVYGEIRTGVGENLEQAANLPIVKKLDNRYHKTVPYKRTVFGINGDPNTTQEGVRRVLDKRQIAEDAVTAAGAGMAVAGAAMMGSYGVHKYFGDDE